MWNYTKILDGITGRVGRGDHTAPVGNLSSKTKVSSITTTQSYHIADTQSRNNLIVQAVNNHTIGKDVVHAVSDITSAYQVINVSYPKPKAIKEFIKLMQHGYEAVAGKNKLAKWSFGIAIASATPLLMLDMIHPLASLTGMISGAMYMGVLAALKYFSGSADEVARLIHESDSTKIQNTERQYKLDKKVLNSIQITQEGKQISVLEALSKFDQAGADVYFDAKASVLKVAYRAQEQFDSLDLILRTAVSALEKKQNETKLSAAEAKTFKDLRNTQLLLRGIVPVGGREVAMADRFFLTVTKTDLKNINLKDWQRAGICITELNDKEYLVQINYRATKIDYKQLTDAITAPDALKAVRFAYTVSHRYISDYADRNIKAESIKNIFESKRQKAKASLLTYFTYGGPAGAWLQDLYAATANMVSFPIALMLTVNMDGRAGSFLMETIGKLIGVRTKEARRTYIDKAYGDRLNKTIENQNQGGHQDRRERNVFQLDLLLADNEGRAASGVQMKQMALVEALTTALPSDGISRHNMLDLLHKIGLGNASEGLETEELTEKENEFKNYVLKHGFTEADFDVANISREEFVVNMTELMELGDKEIIKEAGKGKIDGQKTLSRKDVEEFAARYYDHYKWFVIEEGQINGLVRELIGSSAVLSAKNFSDKIDALTDLIQSRFAINDAKALKTILKDLYAKSNVVEMEKDVQALMMRNVSKDIKGNDGMDYYREISPELWKKVLGFVPIMSYGDQGEEDSFVAQNMIMGNGKFGTGEYSGEVLKKVLEIDKSQRAIIEKEFSQAQPKMKEYMKDKNKGGLFEYLRRKFAMDVFKDKELSEKQRDQLSVSLAIAFMKKWSEIQADPKYDVSKAPGHSIVQKEESAFAARIKDFEDFVASAAGLNYMRQDLDDAQVLSPLVTKYFNKHKEALITTATSSIAGMQQYQVNMAMGMIAWMGGVDASLDKLTGEKFLKGEWGKGLKEQLQGYQKQQTEMKSSVLDKAAHPLGSYLNNFFAAEIIRVNDSGAFTRGNVSGWDMDGALGVKKLLDLFDKKIVASRTDEEADLITVNTTKDLKMNLKKGDELYDRELVHAGQVDLPVFFDAKHKELQDYLQKNGLIVADAKNPGLFTIKPGWKNSIDDEAKKRETVSYFTNELRKVYENYLTKIAAYHAERAELREDLYAYIESPDGLGLNRREVSWKIIQDILDDKDGTINSVLSGEYAQAKGVDKRQAFMSGAFQAETHGSMGNKAVLLPMAEEIFKDYETMMSKASSREKTEAAKRAGEYQLFDQSMFIYDRHIPDISQQQKPNNTSAALLGQNPSEQIKMLIIAVIKEKQKWPNLSYAECFKKMKNENFLVDDKSVVLDQIVVRGKSFDFWIAAERWLSALDTLKIDTNKNIFDQLSEQLEKGLDKAGTFKGISHREFYRIGKAKLPLNERNGIEYYSNADKDNFFYNNFADALSWGWGIDEAGKATKNLYTILFQGPQDFVYSLGNMLQKASIVDMKDFNNRAAFMEGEIGAHPPTGCGGWRRDYYVRTKAAMDVVQRKAPGVIEKRIIKKQYLDLLALKESLKDQKGPALSNIEKQIAKMEKIYGKDALNKAGLDDKSEDSPSEKLYNRILELNHKRFWGILAGGIGLSIAAGIIGSFFVGAVLPFALPVLSVAIVTAGLYVQVKRAISPFFRAAGDVMVKAVAGVSVGYGATFFGASILFGAGAIGLAWLLPVAAVVTAIALIFAFKRPPIRHMFDNGVIYVKKIKVNWETEKADSAVEDAAARNGIIMSFYNSERIPMSIFYADAEGDYSVAKGQFKRWFAAQVELIARELRDGKLVEDIAKEHGLHPALVEHCKHVFESATLQHKFPLMAIPQMAFRLTIYAFSIFAVSAFMFLPIVGLPAAVPMFVLTMLSIGAFNNLMKMLGTVRNQMGFGQKDTNATLGRMGNITFELMKILLSIVYDKATLDFNVTKPVDPPIKQQPQKNIQGIESILNIAFYGGIGRIALGVASIVLPLISPISIPTVVMTVYTLAIAVGFVWSATRSIRNNIIDGLDRKLTLLAGDALQRITNKDKASISEFLKKTGLKVVYPGLWTLTKGAGWLNGITKSGELKRAAKRLKPLGKIATWFNKWDSRIVSIARSERFTTLLAPGKNGLLSKAINNPVIFAGAITGLATLFFAFPAISWVAIVISGAGYIYWLMYAKGVNRNDINFVNEIPGINDQKTSANSLASKK